MTTDPGSTFNTALDLGVLRRNRNLNGLLDAENRADVFQFRLNRSANFSSLVRGRGGGEVRVTLFNDDRRRIAQSEQAGRRGAIETILDAGTYFVKLLRQNGNFNYRLNLAADRFTPPEDNAGNTLDTGRLISLSPSSSVFSDFVGSADTDDFYSFDVTAPSQLNLVLDGLSADANLQVLNSNGAVIGDSTTRGTVAEILTLNLNRGRYSLRVLPGTIGANTFYDLTAALNPLRLIALTTDNSLIAFNPDRPSSALRIGGVTGLAANESIVGIDFRPASGRLFALGRSNQVYTIDFTTAVATPFGAPINPGLIGTSFGVDFNPVADRFRVVSDQNQNLRLNPVEATNTVSVVDGNATLPGVQTDPDLIFDSSDVNATRDPNIVATAYTNNRADAASTPQLTTQFVIDSTLDILARQGSPAGSPISPNAGRIFTVGALGFNFADNTAFDISTDANRVDTAYAISNSVLYTINLTTGAATNLGTISLDGTNPISVVDFSTTIV
jgi:hypothetical protein